MSQDEQQNPPSHILLLTGNCPSIDRNQPLIISFHLSNFHNHSSIDQNPLALQLYYLPNGALVDVKSSKFTHKQIPWQLNFQSIEIIVFDIV